MKKTNSTKLENTVYRLFIALVICTAVILYIIIKLTTISGPVHIPPIYHILVANAVGVASQVIAIFVLITSSVLMIKGNRSKKIQIALYGSIAYYLILFAVGFQFGK